MTVYRRETHHFHWMTLRSAVDESDTLPIATTAKKANIPSHAYTIPPAINVCELRFLANADGASCTAYVYVARKNDDISLLASIAVTSGKQISTGGLNYADTLVVTTHWFGDKEPKTRDANGNDRMAAVAFDLLGYDKIFVLLDISSGSWTIEHTGL